MVQRTGWRSRKSPLKHKILDRLCYQIRFCATRLVSVKIYGDCGTHAQVWCCTLSNDSELVVTGSRDRTIRLWRVRDGSQAAAIGAGVDVFRVVLSNDQRTIVALADRLGARKLVMLRVLRGKLRTSSGGSRATSPLLSSSSQGIYDYAYC